MPKALEYPVFLANKGVALDKPSEFMLEQFSPYSRNMEFYNELLQGRLGLTKFDQVALSGRIKRVANYRKFNSIRRLMFCTPKDIYVYDFSNTRFDILTPIYETGTIAITGLVVTGTGTSWSTNTKAGDYIKIGSGDVNTSSNWYEILSVDSSTQLTLVSGPGDIVAGTAYVIRKIFSGGNTCQWHYRQFTDENLGDVVIFVNGADTPVYWDGTGQVKNISGLPTDFVSAKFIEVYKDRVIFLATYEGGSLQSQRSRFSGVANCLSWDDLDFEDFVDEATEITGTAKFNGYHIVFKETEAYLGRFVGGDFIFDYEKSSQCIGTRAAGSIVTRNQFVGYYGSDKKFHLWNLLEDKIITEDIFPDTKEFDDSNEVFIEGADFPRKNQIRWFCPFGDVSKNNYTVVFNYEKNITQIWEYEQEDACATIGVFKEESDIYADDVTYGAQYADETTTYADGTLVASATQQIVYGGYDGYVRFADDGDDDDGEEYNRILRFKRLNFNAPNNNKRLHSQAWWLIPQTEGNVLIKMRIDDKNTYHSKEITISLVDSTAAKEVIKMPAVWNVRGINFQPEISSTSFFALIGFMNYVYKKGNKFGRS